MLPTVALPMTEKTERTLALSDSYPPIYFISVGVDVRVYGVRQRHQDQPQINALMNDSSKHGILRSTWPSYL